MLLIPSFITDDEGALNEMGVYAKCMCKTLMKLKKHSTVVGDMMKALMTLPCIDAVSMAELWSYTEGPELDTSMNGEVLSVLHIRGRLISSHSDGTIKVWETGKRTPRLIYEAREHSKAVTCLHVSSSCDKLYSGSLDRTIRVHDMKEAVLGLTANSNVACFSTQGTGVYNWSGSPKHVNFNKYVKCLALAGDKLYCGCTGYSIQEVDLSTYTTTTFYTGTKKLLGKQTILSLEIHKDVLFAGGSSVDGIAGKDSGLLNYDFNLHGFECRDDYLTKEEMKEIVADNYLLVASSLIDLYYKIQEVYLAIFPKESPLFVGAVEQMCLKMCNFRPYHSLGDEADTKNALTDWNNKDPSRLLSLILELRELYMAYQRKRVGDVDDDRLKFEFSTMLPREGIEYFLSSGIDKPEEVKFSIPLLDLDLNKMVAGSTWRHQQKIYLQVLFTIFLTYTSAYLSTPRLKLVSSPEVKELFSVEDFRLPSWVDGMCTAEYLPALEVNLATQIKDAVSSIEIRRKFIVALAPLLGRPLEADPVKASFLSNSGVFNFLVHFSIPLQFPKQKPSLMLQSAQHFNSLNIPIKSGVITEYPWSPRWEASEMAERIFDFLVEECLNFKKYCNETMFQQR
nr:BRCA1-A complex subunit BRE [Ipomoea batatas]